MMTRQPSRSAWPLRCGAAFAALVTAGAATAQDTRAGADVYLGAEVAKNPYSEQGNTEVSAAGLAEIRPWVQVNSSLTSLSIEGSVQARQYTRFYGLEDNYSASARLAHRASERLTLTAGASASSSVSRMSDAFGFIGPVTGGPELPVLPEPPLLDDVTVLGVRGRTTSLGASAGAAYVIDERRTVQVDADYRDLSYDRITASDYASLGIQTRFNQTIDATTAVGVILGFRQSDYEGVAIGDAKTYTAMGSINHRLDERWTVTASLGASRTSVEASTLAPAFQWTSLTAQGSACSRDELGSVCIDYQRQPQPTGLGSVRNMDMLGLNYNRRLSERDSVAIGASYSRTGEGAGTVVGAIPSAELLSARARYERQFSQRLGGFLSVSASRVSRAGMDIDPSVNVGAGVTIRLGQRR